MILRRLKIDGFGALTGSWTSPGVKLERNRLVEVEVDAADGRTIAVRYAEWEIIGPGEVRRPIDGYFNPGRREGE